MQVIKDINRGKQKSFLSTEKFAMNELVIFLFVIFASDKPYTNFVTTSRI